MCCFCEITNVFEKIFRVLYIFFHIPPEPAGWAVKLFYIYLRQPLSEAAEDLVIDSPGSRGDVIGRD